MVERDFEHGFQKARGVVGYSVFKSARKPSAHLGGFSYSTANSLSDIASAVVRRNRSSLTFHGTGVLQLFSASQRSSLANVETRATQHCASIAPRSSLSSCETFRDSYIIMASRTWPERLQHEFRLARKSLGRRPWASKRNLAVQIRF
jgi:hypothetical protein